MHKPDGYLLSLFCGCGGLDLGFEQAGYSTALAYDRRQDSLSSWNRNFSGGRAIDRDIFSLSLAQIDRDFGSEIAPVGVIGGPPCQGFSLANRQGSESDPRNNLVGKFFDLALSLNQRKPVDFIVMENVPAIVGKRGGSILETQRQKLEDAGFVVGVHVLNSVDYLVPQTRRRLFLVAINQDKYPDQTWAPPKAIHGRATVRMAISHLPEPVRFRTGLKVEDIPIHPNHWCMNPKSPKFFTGELQEGYVAKRSFKTLTWDEPSYTAAYGNREVHVHPNCERRLSVLEAMIIQGFPEKFILNGTLSSQITQVSEAVPPPLAYAVARTLKKLQATTAAA